MFGIGTTFQLGIGHLIAELSKRRGGLDTLQEVRPATPVPRQKRALKHHIGASGQRRARGFGVFAKSAALDLYDTAPSVFEAGQMRRLMGIALLLQQRCIFGVFPRFRPPTTHMAQIKAVACGQPMKRMRSEAERNMRPSRSLIVTPELASRGSPRESPQQIAMSSIVYDGVNF